MNTTLPPRIVLYDCVCAVCDATVQWILNHDHEGKFHFAPLQGPTAARLLARHPELPENLDSIVLIDSTRGPEKAYWYTGALLGIVRHLPMPWRLSSALWLVPSPLRNLGYKVFAAVRYRIFGTLEACRLPTEDEASRFLD